MNTNYKNIYFISDTHFGQWFANWFFNRPFKNLDHMNKEIIKNWNEVVSKDDVVIIVGDFYSGNRDFLSNLVNSLNGEKILIKGNHDFKFRYRKLINEGKIEVYDKLVLKHEDVNILLSHVAYPFLAPNTINIHGHYHRKLRPIELNGKYYYNVCVEHNDYKPVSLETILQHYHETKDWKEHLCDFLEQINKRRILNKQYLLT